MIANVEQVGGRATGLAVIEPLCLHLEVESAKLDEQVGALEADIEALKKKHLPAMKRQAAVVAQIEAELTTAVDDSPDCFKKPKTMLLHGIKVGFQATEGKLVIDDVDITIKAIKRVFGESAELYLSTTTEPHKRSLKELPKEQLAKLGCRIEDAGDQVLVKRTAGDIEKLFKKLTESMVGAMLGED